MSNIIYVEEEYVGMTAIHPFIDPIHPFDMGGVVTPPPPVGDGDGDGDGDGGTVIVPPVGGGDPVIPPTTVINHNLFDLSTVNAGFYITEDGGVARSISPDNYSVSDFIAVDYLSDYTVSSNQVDGQDSFIHVAFYDKDKRFISRRSLQDRVRKNMTFNMSTKGTAFIRLNINAGRADAYNRMIIKGSVPLPYKEYRSNRTPPAIEVMTVPPIAEIIVNAEDFENLQAAVDYVADLGRGNGGSVKINIPDTSANVVIKTNRIRIFSELPNAILRCVSAPGNPGPIQVLPGGTNFTLEGLDCRGQKLSDHNKSNVVVVDGVESKRVNATGYCSIIIKETGATLRNFKAQYTGLDSVNANFIGDINLLIEDFYIGTSGRNPFSLINGINVTIRRGTFYIDNTITGARDGEPTDGLYLFDIEPNNEHEIWHSMFINDVTFINNGKEYGNNEVIFQDASETDLNHMNLHITDCEFIGLNGRNAAIARIKLDNASKTVSGVHFKRVKCDQRALTKEGDDQYMMINSTFDDVVSVSAVSLTYAIRLSRGCFVNNFRNINGKNVFVRHNVGEAVITNTKLDPASYK